MLKIKIIIDIKRFYWNRRRIEAIDIRILIKIKITLIRYYQKKNRNQWFELK